MDLAVEVVDYFSDNELIFQMLCYCLTRREVDPDATRKLTSVSESFLNMFNLKLRNKGIAAKPLASQAFSASIFGVMLTFLHHPNLSHDEKKGYMHRLVLAFIKGERWM